MKPSVLGAAGVTGIPLVEQALAAGHRVTALVRSGQKLTITNLNLHVEPNPGNWCTQAAGLRPEEHPLSETHTTRAAIAQAIWALRDALWRIRL
jgi:nucleoside-diphosphate-sugar epimerase